MMAIIIVRVRLNGAVTKRKGVCWSGGEWLVFVATAASIANEDARAEFAFNVARALASRGAVFEFHVVAMSLEELAQSLL